jgi:hypothetical protein
MRRHTLALVLALLAGCGDDPDVTPVEGNGPQQPGPGGGGADQDAGVALPPPLPDLPDAGPPPGPSNGPMPGDKTCGLKKFGLQRQPAEMMLVLDRSGSMRYSSTGGFSPNATDTKWAWVTTAVNRVLNTTQDSLMWGLKLYPSGDGCSVGPGAEVPLALNNHARMMAVINGSFPGGQTPTRVAIEEAVKALKARPTTNPKYIVLATDGQPNCGDGAVEAVAAARTAGFPTFVLGIAIGSDARETLNDMAEKGGRPRMGEPRFYAVTNNAELTRVLDTIVGQVSSCNFALGEVPPSPDDVAVDADGRRVTRDLTRTNGWDYANANKRTVTLFGPWCERLKTGAIKNVQITYGCPGVVIP